MPPAVTVIIPVLNEAASIRTCVGAILAQDYPPDCLELLVIDGGSTDDTRAIISEMAVDDPRLKLLHNPQKIQAAALNIGIRAAQGEIIIRVDGHTRIAPDYVSQCVELLVEGKAQNVGGLMRSVGDSYTGQAIALATGSPFGIGGSKFHYAEQAQYVDTVYLGAYWRETLEEIGLYDDRFAINEDYELNYRLRQAGGKILLSPHIHSIYTPRSSLWALMRQYFRYGRWKVRTLQKHPASLQWRQAVPPLFVAACLLTLLTSLIWPVVGWLFALVAGSYLLANLAASVIVAARQGWQYLPMLPLVFAIIHVIWGVGFWVGLLRLPFDPFTSQ